MATPELEISDLELQVDNIIKSHQHLVLENNSLRKKNHVLAQELAVATEKKDKVLGLLRKIITQLKDELACPQK